MVWVWVWEEVGMICEVDEETDMIALLVNYTGPEINWAVSVDLGLWS